MKKIKIIFFSANRAEYGLIYPFLKIFLNHAMFNVELVVAGSHFSKKFGLSIEEIKKDKIKFTKIDLHLSTNTLDDTSDYFCKLQNKVNLFLKKRKTDLVFLSSDRFETFAFAISSYLKKIPIIHYEGGDVTEGGALDDNIRHAITKIANIHLTSNKDSFNRILNMGEEKWRCLNVGYAPFYDIKKKKFDEKAIKEKFLIDPKKPLILFTFHPVVKNKNDLRKDVDEVFKSLEYLSKDNQIIITYPNFDPGHQYIIDKIINIKEKFNILKVVKHLGRTNYHSLLYYIGKNKKGFCMGNSSSGIKETIFFNCPTLNIGDRQKSRLKPYNVIDVKPIKSKIIKSVAKNLKIKKVISNNPYKITKKFFNLPQIIQKKFKGTKFTQKKCTL